MTPVFVRQLLALVPMLMALLYFLSCSNQAERSEIVYHIIEREKPAAGIGPNEPPPPPAPYYGMINLILLSPSTVYVHWVHPANSLDPDYSDRPMAVDLNQKDILKVDLDSLPQFLNTEYRDLDSTNFRSYFTCIKSPSDTITNRAFPVIQQFFQDRQFKAYIIRQWTPREQQVITSMK